MIGREIATQLMDISESLEHLAGEIHDIRSRLMSVSAEEDDAEHIGVVSFMAAVKMLRAGELRVGMKVTGMECDGESVEWRVIHIGQHKTGKTVAVLQTCNVIDYSVFDKATKEHPFGQNKYTEAVISEYVNGELLSSTFEEDACVVPREIDGEPYSYWLLSQEEVGAGDPDEAYQWYDPEELTEDELAERRMMLDTDGDPSNWWLRSPLATSVYNARAVRTSGALTSTNANHAHGVAPACFIG